MLVRFDRTTKDEKAVAILQEIASEHLGGVARNPQGRSAPRSLAKAVVRLATEVGAD